MSQSVSAKEPPDHTQPRPALQAAAVEMPVSPGTPFPRAVLQNPMEVEALARAQAGDHQAFAQLYSLYKRRIYSLCLRMLGKLAEAEDLTQEVFLQLHRRIASFRGDLRKKGLAVISLDQALEPEAEERAGRSFGAPDLSLSGAIDRLALARAVDGLPAGYRLIFVLHDVEGYEHNEIAAMLDCSDGNSKSQLHKARLKLREALRTNSRQEARR